MQDARMCLTLTGLPVEVLQGIWPRTKVQLGVQACRTLRVHLLCQVSADGNEVPNVILVARPFSFASEKAATNATALLRQLERPIDLVLAGSGRYCGKAVGHALRNGFDPLLLRTLDISRSCLSDADVGSICATVGACTMLERLSLAFNGLEGDGIRVLAQLLLPRLARLTSLDLSHNGCGGWVHATADSIHKTACLDVESMRDFRHVNYVVRSPTRKRAVTSEDGVGSSASEEEFLATEAGLDHSHRQRGIDYQGMLSLTRALIRLPLRELNLGCNKLSDASISLIAGALFGGEGGLRREWEGDHVDSADIGYGQGSERRACDSDHEAADGVSARCEVLRLHSNDLTALGARHLAAVLPTCRVSLLDLSDNGISSAGAASLGSALAASSSLRQLHLGANAIGDAGIREIAAALPSAPRLTHLDLSDNRIVDEGATYLARALSLSPALRNLCLACNQIGDQGAARIASALLAAHAEQGHRAPASREPASSSPSAAVASAPPSLQLLDVRGNRVGAEGGKRLTEAAPAGCQVMLRF